MSKFSSAWRAPPPGARVNACMPDAYMVLDPCVHLDNWWSTLRVHRVYEVLGPFGAGGDDCSVRPFGCFGPKIPPSEHGSQMPGSKIMLSRL